MKVDHVAEASPTYLKNRNSRESGNPVSIGYKQTEIGTIPEDWEVCELASLAEIRSGIAKNSSVQIIDPIKVYYLRVANVQDGYLDLSSMATLGVSKENVRRYAVFPGDMLMNEGGDLDKLGRGALWKGEFFPCIHQNHVFVVRCRDRLTPEFLNAWTAAPEARKYFLLAGRQTTNLASISKTALGHFPVPLPNELAEQTAIANALSDVDALINELEKLIAKKQSIKTATMQQLLTGRTRLPQFALRDDGSPKGYKQSALGEIPEDWEALMLGEALIFQRGFDLPNRLRVAGDVPIVSSSGISGFHNYAIENPPGIVTGRYGTIGEIFYLKEAYWPLNTTLFVKAFNKLLPEYSFHFLKTVDFESHSGKSGVPGVNRSDLHKEIIPVPMLLEQTAIATILSDMDDEIQALEQRLNKTRHIKQGMMQELLTGKTRLI